jgi:hypothetical protein
LCKWEIIVMFTPQKKVWSGWSALTPRSGGGTQKSALGSSLNPNSGDAGKGKTVAFVETTPTLGNGENIFVDAAGDPELLAEKVSKLETEVCGGLTFFVCDLLFLVGFYSFGILNLELVIWVEKDSFFI